MKTLFGIFIFLSLSLLVNFGVATAETTDEDKAIMQRAADELAASDIIKDSLGMGDKAEDFTLPNVDGEDTNLGEELKKGPVILTFYRGSWCPFCNQQLHQLQERVEDFENLGAQLIAVSPEKPDFIQLSIIKNKLTYKVLSDLGNKVAKDYGITFKLSEQLLPIYKKFGIDLSEHNSDDSNTLPIPATYVINTDGTIVYVFKNTDYKKRANPEKIITVLEELKKQ